VIIAVVFNSGFLHYRVPISIDRRLRLSISLIPRKACQTKRKAGVVEFLKSLHQPKKAMMSSCVVELLLDRTCERQLVAVWIGHMEIAFSPGRISRNFWIKSPIL
jgi:hypothetical protein